MNGRSGSATDYLEVISTPSPGSSVSTDYSDCHVDPTSLRSAALRLAEHQRLQQSHSQPHRVLRPVSAFGKIENHQGINSGQPITNQELAMQQHLSQTASRNDSNRMHNWEIQNRFPQQLTSHNQMPYGYNSLPRRIAPSGSVRPVPRQMREVQPTNGNWMNNIDHSYAMLEPQVNSYNSSYSASFQAPSVNDIYAQSTTTDNQREGYMATFIWKLCRYNEEMVNFQSFFCLLLWVYWCSSKAGE